MMKKIVIVNIGGIGDIINSTPIAKYYKEKQNKRVVFATIKKYKFLLEDNKYIDEIILLDEIVDKIKNINKNLYFENVGITRFMKYRLKLPCDVVYTAPYSADNYDGTPRETLLDIIKYETSQISNFDDFEFIFF